ncbi:MAG: methyl-accepting chemotaxis protein [Lachnospiraceae bacterium]|nr:methyl-accepting chemotaxis protein [Lachnospiraceae bacterium]
MGINIFRHMEESMVKIGLEQADMAAVLAVKQLDGDMVALIGPDSEGKEEYQTLLVQMRELKEDCGVAFMYTLYTDGKQVYYGVDTDATSSQSSPGDIFEVSYEELRDVFQGSKYVQDYIDHTEDGDLVSVYQPVLDSSGKVVAVLGCDYDADNVVSALNEAREWVIGLGSICLVISVICLNIIVGRIMRSLRIVDKKIYELVHNKGDLTQKLEVRTGDEMELIADNVNALLEFIRQIMLNIANNSQNLAKSSEHIVQNLYNAEGSITDVSATMEQMSAAMEETSSSLGQVHAAIEEISRTIEAISQKADSERDSSKAIYEKAKEVYETAVISQKNAKQQAEQMISSVNEKIEKSRAVEEIGGLTAQIINITSQTNLLALNASIEAARAGEAGKGFAVVADEIGKLATDSAKVAAEIRTVSANVTEAVNELSREAENMLKFMEKVAMGGYEKLLETSGNYQKDVESMTVIMREFAEESQQVRENIDSIRETASMLNDVVEDNAKGVVNVAERSTELTVSMRDISAEADANMAVSNQLNEEVAKFRLQ